MAHDRNNQAPRAQCPEEVLAWIPWYPDGLLNERERGAVEAHAATCGDCRNEIDLVSGAPWACEGVELPDAERVFDAITARIAAAERREGATVIPISRGRVLSEEDIARLERWVLDPDSERDAGDDELAFGHDARAAAQDASFSRHDAPASGQAAPISADEESASAHPVHAAGHARAGVAMAGPARARRVARGSFSTSPAWAAAAAVLLFVLGGLAGGYLRAESADDARGAEAEYALASAKPAARSQDEAPTIDVVFSDAVSARQIWSTLRGLGVEIVAGPTNLGVYRLRLRSEAGAGAEGEAADAAAIAAKLVEGEARIAIFAEPVP